MLRAAATAAVAPTPAAEVPEWSAAAAAAVEGGAAGAAGAEGVVAKARKMLQRCRGILTTHEQVRFRNACAPTGKQMLAGQRGCRGLSVGLVQLNYCGPSTSPAPCCLQTSTSPTRALSASRNCAITSLFTPHNVAQKCCLSASPPNPLRLPQVSLLPDAMVCSGPLPTPDVLYDGAMAHIAQGFASGWPHHVARGLGLLEQLEGQLAHEAEVQRLMAQQLAELEAARAMRGGAGGYADPHGHRQARARAADRLQHEHPEPHHHVQQQAQQQGAAASGPEPAWAGGVALEKAVCYVLLGDYAKASQLLGLSKPSGRGGVQAADAQLLAFVTVRAEEGPLYMAPCPAC